MKEKDLDKCKINYFNKVSKIHSYFFVAKKVSKKPVSFCQKETKTTSLVFESPTFMLAYLFLNSIIFATLCLFGNGSFTPSLKADFSLLLNI